MGHGELFTTTLVLLLVIVLVLLSAANCRVSKLILQVILTWRITQKVRAILYCLRVRLREN